MAHYQEEVYMHQGEGFDDSSGWVCKLKRSLYSLKQAPTGWNQQFVDFMKKNRPKLVQKTHVYLCTNINVAIYVHDSLTAGSNESDINVFIDQLHHNFKIMMGTLSNFLGMQVG
jgi:hypothetical protein